MLYFEGRFFNWYYIVFRGNVENLGGLVFFLWLGIKILIGILLLVFFRISYRNLWKFFFFFSGIFLGVVVMRVGWRVVVFIEFD